MWSSEVTNMIITGIWETLYMTLVSTLVGYVIGLPMGIILTVSDKDGIKPNAVLYKILDVGYGLDYDGLGRNYRDIYTVME